MGELIEGAMQQAPQPERQSMTRHPCDVLRKFADINRRNGHCKTPFRTMDRALLLELEVQRRALDIAATVIAHLQLHFIAQQSPVELERTAVGR